MQITTKVIEETVTIPTAIIQITGEKEVLALRQILSHAYWTLVQDSDAYFLADLLTDEEGLSLTDTNGIVR